MTYSFAFGLVNDLQPRTLGVEITFEVLLFVAVVTFAARHHIDPPPHRWGTPLVVIGIIGSVFATVCTLSRNTCNLPPDDDFVLSAGVVLVLGMLIEIVCRRPARPIAEAIVVSDEDGIR